MAIVHELKTLAAGDITRKALSINNGRFIR